VEKLIRNIKPKLLTNIATEVKMRLFLKHMFKKQFLLFPNNKVKQVLKQKGLRQKIMVAVVLKQY